MNREIKFKAFCPKLKVMSKPFSFNQILNFGDVVFNSLDLKKHIVMQFTGLVDKNGVDIYEGDIVKCYDYSALDEKWNLDNIHIGVIEWTSPQFSLKIPGKQTLNTPCVKHWENDVYLYYWDNAENVEGIGNIHTNPELLNNKS